MIRIATLTEPARLWPFLAAIILAWPAATPALAEPLPPDLDFDVFRGDVPIGRHSVSFRREGDRLVAEIEIELTVSFGFIDLFRYRHTNREVWRDGKLVSIETATDDNGRLYRVSGVATPAGLHVRAGEREFTAPHDILPTSYWRPETTARRRFLDTQYGRLIELEIDETGRDQFTVDGLTIAADRYAVGGDLAMTLWYSDTGRWLGVSFAARGAEVRYRPGAGMLSVAHGAGADDAE